MANAWKVIWFEGGRKLKKTGFPGDSPRASGAIDYAKAIIARGIPADKVHVVSQRRPFAPSDKMKLQQTSGMSWCPYCVKWREFKYCAIKMGEQVIPEDFRCPICSISVNDFSVKLYNPMLYARSEARAVRVGKPVPVARRR